jgi:hypothetical protein
MPEPIPSPSGESVFFACTTIDGGAPALEKNLRLWPHPDRCYIAFDRKTRLTSLPDVDAHWIYFADAPSTDYQRLCPWDSYSRKNIAFIEAARAGAGYIFETDDDNELIVGYEALAAKAAVFATTVAAGSHAGTVNLFADIYDQVDGNVWARGFPLRHIETRYAGGRETQECRPGVVQFLVDGNPDVDAIFRLVRGADLDMQANRRALPLAIANAYHPFNSQATLWPRATFPLMYLPSSCPFRMTDVWRGYIAQRILQEAGRCVVFEGPVVRQIRNVHAIHDDFFDEHPGYVQSERVIDTLRTTDFSGHGSLEDMLLACYERLCRAGVFERRELVLLKAWCEAIN